MPQTFLLVKGARISEVRPLPWACRVLILGMHRQISVKTDKNIPHLGTKMPAGHTGACKVFQCLEARDLG